jgi:hypothetical protein
VWCTHILLLGCLERVLCLGWECKEGCDDVSYVRPSRVWKGRKCLGLICNLDVCSGRDLYCYIVYGREGVVICCDRFLLGVG